jgi:hypothetical protein
MAGDDLGGVHERPVGVARVDALGAVAEVEVRADGQPGLVLEQRRQELSSVVPG